MKKKASSPKALFEKELASIVKKLVEQYRPEKIIVFGSLAQGRVDAESDLDLLVIKRTGERRLNRRIEALRGVPRNIPLDVIILTPEEIAILEKEKSPFIQEILATGKVVYEQKPLA